MRNQTFSQFIKFTAFGLINTGLDFLILNLLHGYLGLNLILANTISTLSAITLSYILNYNWTFPKKDKNQPTLFVQYLVVSLIGLGLNDLILFFLADKLSLNYNLGKLIATCIVLFWNFFINKLWTFKITSDQV